MSLDWNSKSDADFEAFHAFLPKLFFRQVLFYSVMVFKSKPEGNEWLLPVTRYSSTVNRVEFAAKKAMK